jgi:PAS domain S-box-containing protein
MTELDLPATDPLFLKAMRVLERLASAGAAASVRSPGAAARHDAGAALPAPEEVKVPQPVLASHFSETTHRALLESLPDAMVVINGDGAIVFVNEQTERVFGYQRGELLGRSIEILVPEDARGAHVEHRRRYFASPHTRPMGARLSLFGRHKDGSLFPVEISLSPIQSEAGTLATTIIRDVSLRQREAAKFRALVENIPAVTFIAPLDESVPELYVSPQIEELLGFTQKEWTEDPVLWHRQLHPADRERWNRQFAPTCASGEPFDDDYRFLAKDGRVVWVHGSARMVRDAEGKLLFLQGVAFDITKIKAAEIERKRAEEALRQANADLERRVEERTKELQHSLTALEKKTEELEHFAFVASHDLAEPLRSLKNYPVKLAKTYQGKIDDTGYEWINRTIGGVNRLEQLIKHLLAYSRVVRRNRGFGPTDSAAGVQDACANLQAAIDECGGEVTLSELPSVMGSHEELVLLFQNLIGNAVKFRDPERPVRVEVCARPAQDRWLFSVRDNGIGIETKFYQTQGPAEPKLFSLGVEGRVFPSRSKYPGNGYGLHICKKIVTRHGGKIWVESEFGQGSTFFFTLPADPGAKRALTSATPTAPAAEP